MTNFRDRIKCFKRLNPEDISPDPLNYKIHTPDQRKHFRSILEEVGIAGAVLVRETKRGKYQLIGGHMRKSEITQPIPALVIDVTAKAATELLARLDTVAELADTDESVMAELLDAIGIAGKEFNDALAALCPTKEPDFNAGGRAPMPEEAEEDEEPATKEGTRIIPLVFTKKQKAEFLTLATKLSSKYSTDNFSDTAFNAFKEWEGNHGKGNRSRKTKAPGKKLRR